MLAHVLEAHGLATIAISLVRPQIEAAAPPRALHCDFPLGRPLGKPGDAAFQHRVLRAALGLLEAPAGPVLIDFDETVPAADDDDTLACPLPPPTASGEHPAVAEAKGLLPAFNRATSDINVPLDPAAIPDLVRAFVRLAEGESVESVGLADTRDASLRLRAYYERAALELSGHTPAARATENWFYHQTEAGKVLLAARRRLHEQGADRFDWFFLAPVNWPF